MTVSTGQYAATLVVDEYEYELGTRGGTIVLDEGAAPHVSGSLELAAPADLSTVDPRVTPRCRVDVTDASGLLRRFDLGVRSRELAHLSRVVRLPLASDEALLSDARALVDDWTPRAHAASLRDVVDYVLTEVLDVELAATPDVDSDVTPFWEASNLMPDPSFETGTTAGWAPAVNAPTLANVGTHAYVGTRSLAVTATAGGGLSTISPVVTARPGQSYGGSLCVRSSVSRDVTVTVRFTNASGGTTDVTSPSAATSTSAWSRVAVLAVAPADAVSVRVFFTASSNTIGDIHYLDAVMISPDTEILPFFYGATPDDADYTYANSGGAGVRTPIVDRPRESLLWSAGQSALDFLHPLVQAAGFRLVCDETRVWTLRDETYSAPGALNVRHGVNLIDAADLIDRDGGLWFDAQVTRYTWTDRAGVTHTRTDEYALTTPPTRVNLVEVEAPYPGPGRSEYAVRRAQGRGRELEVTTRAIWDTPAEQACRFVLEGTPTQLGETSRVTFDLATDRMTVLARTTDTPDGAVDLLAGTVDELTGIVDDL